MLKVLLLDCDSNLQKIISELGFEVSLGYTGFSDGHRDIPVALSEQDIIFYQPKSSPFLDAATVTKNKDGCSIANIKKQWGVSLSNITDFFSRGGALISFYEKISDDIEKEYAVYSWIPQSPLGIPTNDRDISIVADPQQEMQAAFISLFQDCKVKKPITRELDYYGDFTYPYSLLVSARKNTLAGFVKIEKGLSVSLPAFESMEAVIKHFLLYVYPRLYKLKPSHETINLPMSLRSTALETEVKEKESQLIDLSRSLGETRAELIRENNRIEQLIQKDANAKRLIGYIEESQYDKKGSWHSCYKITELLFKIYGSEISAKRELNGSKQINYIRKITNDSHRDTRHSPKPGEIVKPPTVEEIDEMIEDAKFLVEAHLKKLVEAEVAIESSSTNT